MIRTARLTPPVRLAGLLLTALLILLAALFAPVEQTLGQSIRLIYFHGAWVWAGIITFGLAALAGVVGLVIRRGWPGVSLTLGRTGLFFWLTYLPVSLLVMQIYWGGLFLDEPRWRIPFTFAVVGVLLQTGIALMSQRWLTCLGNFLFGAALYWELLPAGSVLHPDSPVFGSNSIRIQVSWLVLLALSLLFGLQLAAWLYQLQRSSD